MKIEENELKRLGNILMALRKARHDFTGEECLAFAQAYTWLIREYEAAKRPAPPVKSKSESEDII